MCIYKQMKMLVFVVTVMYIVFLWMCDMTHTYILEFTNAFTSLILSLIKQLYILYTVEPRFTTSSLKRPPQNCNRLKSVPIFSLFLNVHFSFITNSTPKFRIMTSVFGPVYVLSLIIMTTSLQSERNN